VEGDGDEVELVLGGLLGHQAAPEEQVCVCRQSPIDLGERAAREGETSDMNQYEPTWREPNEPTWQGTPAWAKQQCAT